MASSKTQLSSTALILSLNILFFTMVVSSNTPCSPVKVPPKGSPSAPAKQNPPKGSHSAPVNPAPYPKETCPRDTLKLGACANLLNGLVNVVVGTPPSSPNCCPLIEGIADLEAAACLCTALKANVLGVVNVKLDIALTLILNHCGKGVPSGSQCA